MCTTGLPIWREEMRLNLSEQTMQERRSGHVGTQHSKSRKAPLQPHPTAWHGWQCRESLLTSEEYTCSTLWLPSLTSGKLFVPSTTLLLGFRVQSLPKSLPACLTLILHLSFPSALVTSCPASSLSLSILPFFHQQAWFSPCFILLH